MKALLKTLFVTAAAALLFIVAPVLTNPAQAADIQAGGQLFSANCAVCHQGGNNTIMNIKTLKVDALEKFLDGYGPNHNPEAIVKQVTYGKGMMPAFRNRLTDEDIANVAAYVQDQSESGWQS